MKYISKIANSFYILDEYILPNGEQAADVLFRTTSERKANNFLKKAIEQS